MHRSSCTIRGQTYGAGSLCPPLQVTWVAGLRTGTITSWVFSPDLGVLLWCVLLFSVFGVHYSFTWGLTFFFPIRLEKYIPPAYSIPVHTLTRTNKGQQFSHHRIVISCITQGQAEGTTRQLGHRFPESKNTYTEQPTNSSIRICESSKGKKSKDKATYWQGWQKCTRILSVSF